jgi:anti-sigma B factor antagonist
MTDPAESFSARVVRLDSGEVVVLTGELDMASAPELTKVLRPLVANGPREVVFDLSDLDFVDSSGIAALIAVQNQLRQQERHLCIRGAQPSAVRIFEIAGLLDFLNVRTEAFETGSA